MLKQLQQQEKFAFIEKWWNSFGFTHMRKIELLMPDEKGESKTVNGYMLENYLNGDNYLKPEEQQALYVDFKNRNPKLKPKTEEFKRPLKLTLF